MLSVAEATELSPVPPRILNVSPSDTVWLGPESAAAVKIAAPLAKQVGQAMTGLAAVPVLVMGPLVPT
ncbi:MAG: hypothetical protein E6Q36_07875, partial [Chryseobacterium sp.]